MNNRLVNIYSNEAATSVVSVVKTVIRKLLFQLSSLFEMCAYLKLSIEGNRVTLPLIGGQLSGLPVPNCEPCCNPTVDLPLTANTEILSRIFRVTRRRPRL